MKKNNLLIGIIAVLLIALALTLQKSCNQNKELSESKIQINALTDTTKVYRDKQGFLHSERQKLIGQRKDLIAIAEKQDKEIAKLLKDKNTNTVIKWKDNVVYKDSIQFIGDSCYFKATVGDEWVKNDVTVYGNTLVVKTNVTNKYTITDKWKRDKWYKPRYNVIDIKNHNPYTGGADSLMTYSVSKNKSKFKPFWMGLGVGVIGTLILLK